MPDSYPLKKVNVRSIREELRALWASEAMKGEAVIRAQTHNLIVYVADEVSAEETTQRVIESTVDRPGRVIVIDAERGRDKPLDAWVTTYCRKVDQYQICGEMITLTVGTAHQDEVHSTVVSLLAPDLPVYLWWMGSPNPTDQLLAHLAPEAIRILVDSETFPDPVAGLKNLAQLAQHFRVGDLAWARLTTWRRLIAQVWDAPECREALRRLRSLKVTYAAEASAERGAKSLLLIGWLVRKLGWTIKTVAKLPAGGYRVEYHRGKWEGRIEISPAPGRGIPAGEIARITIETGDKPSAVTPKIELNPELGLVETRLNDQITDGPRLINTYPTIDVAGALVEELDLGYDPDYGLALDGAVAILNQTP